MSTPHEALTAQIELIMRARAAAIELECERAIVGGVCGVSVYDDVVTVDPGAPYGEIHHHQCRRDQRRY